MPSKPKAKPAAAEEKSPAPAAAKPAPSSPKSSDSLIMKISDLEKLSPEEKQAFREAGGTSIEG